MKIYIWNEEFEKAEDVNHLTVSLCPEEEYTEIEIEEAVKMFPNVTADFLYVEVEFGSPRRLGRCWYRGTFSCRKDEILVMQEWARRRGEKCKVWAFFKCNRLENYIAEFESIDAEAKLEEWADSITFEYDICDLIDAWFSKEKPSEELAESDPDEYERQLDALDEKVCNWFSELPPLEKISYAGGDWSCSVWE